MAINLKEIPLSGLLTLQQLIEFGSADISNLFFQAMKDCQEHKVSERYFKQLEDVLEEKLKNNNDIMDLLSAEILKRTKKVFPKATTTETMTYLRKSHNKEIENYEKLLGDSVKKEEPKKEAQVIKPVFKKSREKKL